MSTWNLPAKPHSRQTAVGATEALSASNRVGVTLIATVGDQARRTGWWKTGLFRGKRKCSALEFLGLTWLRVAAVFVLASFRVADPGESLGERAGGLVVIRSHQNPEGPSLQWVKGALGLPGHSTSFLSVAGRCAIGPRSAS